MKQPLPVPDWEDEVLGLVIWPENYRVLDYTMKTTDHLAFASSSTHGVLNDVLILLTIVV